MATEYRVRGGEIGGKCGWDQFVTNPHYAYWRVEDNEVRCYGEKKRTD